MCHRLLEDTRLFDLKKRYDEDLAAQTKAARCQECGGRLGVANYQRKPRGGPDGYDLRLSFCCAREGCRTRATPPSLRFLGRKVYFAGMVVLATAMQQGLTPARLSQLRDLLGVSRRTLRRWRLLIPSLPTTTIGICWPQSASEASSRFSRSGNRRRRSS